MRFMVKATIPVEAGNDLVHDPNLGKRMGDILDDLKPEAAYFGAADGQRTMFLIVNMDDSSQIPAVAEPLWLSLKCHVEFIPVMNQEDFGKAVQDIERVSKKY